MYECGHPECSNKHDGSYGSGRFCSEHCARSFSTYNKREEINRKVSETLQDHRVLEKTRQKIKDNHWVKRDDADEIIERKNKTLRKTIDSMTLEERKEKYGHIAWNKDLTKETDKRLAKIAKKNRKIAKRKWVEEERKGISHKLIHDIPHTEESKQKIRIARAKITIPKEDTSIEIMMDEILDELELEYKAHVPILDIEHCYNCDRLVEGNLVIECDGNYWHNYPDGKEIDHIRNKELKEAGYKILRFWGNEIRNDKDKIKKKILESL